MSSPKRHVFYLIPFEKLKGLPGFFIVPKHLSHQAFHSVDMESCCLLIIWEGSGCCCGKCGGVFDSAKGAWEMGVPVVTTITEKVCGIEKSFGYEIERFDLLSTCKLLQI